MELFESLDSTFLNILKIAIFVFLFLFTIFALIVAKQVKVMIQTLEVGFEKQIMFLSYLYLLISLGVFILAIVIL